MFFAETILAAKLLSSDPKARAENDLLYISDGNPSRYNFQIFSGSSMEKLVISEFQDIDGVRDTQTEREGKQLSVKIEVEKFDRPTRNKIFAKEKELYQEFPNTYFDFCLVDVSPEAGEDADSI
jgi:hypothetical protein